MIRKRQLSIGIGILAVVALTMLIILSHAAITRQLHSWKLLPEPERLTELYFTDHTKLPTTYSPGDTVNVAFTIHNIEYRPTTYRYSVTAGSTDVSGSASVNLNNNQAAHITLPITLPDCGSKCQLSVRLNNGESIDYLVTELGGGSQQ